MAKITQQMVDELNKKLETCGVGFRYILGGRGNTGAKNYCNRVRPRGFYTPPIWLRNKSF